MAVKAGKMVLTGASQSVSLPFDPQFVIFLTSDSTAEDSWVSSGVKNGGLGLVSYKNFPTDLTIINSWTGSTWDSNAMCGAFIHGNCLWCRATAGGGGYAFAVTSMSGGFTISYAPGFTAGASGKIVYYCAFGELDHVGQGFFYNLSNTEVLGWEPNAHFATGMGDTSGNAPTPPNFGLAFADADFGGYAMGTSGNDVWVSQGTLDGNDGSGFNEDGLIKGLITAEVFVTDDVGLSYTSTELRSAVDQGVDPNRGARLSGHALGGVAAHGVSSHYPTATIDSPEVVPLTITPDVVFFMTRQPSNSGTADYRGGRAVGLATADFRCVVGYGGDYGTESYKFSSSQRAWISNFTDAPMASGVSAGTASLGPGQAFTSTTKENGKSMQSNFYLAIGTPSARRRHLLPILHAGA
jgi:hypothetical protein